MTPDDVIDMEAKLYLADEPFDEPTDADEDGFVPAGYLADNRFEPATLVAEHEFVDMATSELREAMDVLDARSRDVLESRWLRGRIGKSHVARAR